MTIIHCRACLAWDPVNGGTRNPNDYGAKGFCRRFAPRAILAGTLNGEQGEVWAAVPMTENTDGCCEAVPDVWGPINVTR